MLSAKHEQKLEAFVRETAFREQGAVMLDMDGTALYEREGLVYIPDTVVNGARAIQSLGRPIVLNTLRFPRSIIDTFGHAWYEINCAPIPTVLLNGSLLGYVVMSASGELGYEEVASYPLAHDEIEEMLTGVEGLVASGVQILVFYYPRDWRIGEILWTPDPAHVGKLRDQYVSAAEVISGSVEELRYRLLTGDVNMVFLLAEAPEDNLMAYQHVQKNNFFTRAKVNKSFGAKKMAEHLGFALGDSFGAGDTELDTFLQNVGLAVRVGNRTLPFRGRKATVQVEDAFSLGTLLSHFSDLQRST